MNPRHLPTARAPTQEAGDTEYLEVVTLGQLEGSVSPITPSLTPGSPKSSFLLCGGLLCEVGQAIPHSEPLFLSL